MAAADKRFRWKFFIALLAISFGFIGLVTVYPIEVHSTGLQILNWVFVHLPVGWLFLIGLFAATAIIVLGGAVMVYEKLQSWTA